MSTPRHTEDVRRHYDRTAGRYNRQIKLFERILFGDGRQWVCSRATGEVLEIAVGTGRNLPHYPDGVRVTGWPADSDPIVLNAPYGDNFTVMLILTGQLKPV